MRGILKILDHCCIVAISLFAIAVAAIPVGACWQMLFPKSPIDVAVPRSTHRLLPRNPADAPSQAELLLAKRRVTARSTSHAKGQHLTSLLEKASEQLHRHQPATPTSNRSAGKPTVLEDENR